MSAKHVAGMGFVTGTRIIGLVWTARFEMYVYLLKRIPFLEVHLFRRLDGHDL
jgi:hypothetical protein